MIERRTKKDEYESVKKGLANGLDKPIDVVAVGSWSIFDHLFQVEHLPQPGDTVKIISPSEIVESVYWGGCAQNNVVAAARLGASAALISVVGQDFHERGYDVYLEELGIDLRGTIVVDNEVSGQSFIFSDPNGNSICMSSMGVAARQDEFESDKDLLSLAKVAIINYRFDQFTLKAAQTVREAGGQVIVSGALITGPGFSGLLVDAAHLLVCTEYEIERLIQLLDLFKWTDLFKRGIQALVITQGDKGSLLLTPDGEIHIPVLPPRQVVDPIGAGDSFVGGMAAGLAFGYPLVHAAWLGAAVASYVVEAVGCQTNMPTFQQAAQRVRNYSGPSLI